MPSIQSYLLKFWFRRQNLFGNKKYNPQSSRLQIERTARIAKLHKNVKIIPVDAGTVASEWLIPQGAPQDRALLYLHGGAWFMGSTNTHRSFVSYLAYASGIRALSINYRLAPENPFPAGLDDCVMAYEWLLHSGISSQKIVVAGDSAGGNLTLALLVALHDTGKPLPAGAVALSPATDLALTGASLKTRAHLDPVLANLGSNTIIKDYITDHDPREPLISPLYANLHGLPPLLIHVGDHETLLDDAVRFGARACDSGVDAKTVVWPHMFHVFQIFVPILPEARQAIAQIATFIRSRMDGNSTITRNV
jgi:monoterpene epsilon-lactone hydrolase